MRRLLAAFAVLALTGMAVTRSWCDEGDMRPGGNMPLRDVPEPVAQRYGDSLRGFRSVSPRRLSVLFPEHRFHEATVFNPGSAIAGPPTVLEAVMERQGAYRFISSDRDACGVLTDAGSPVPDLASAIDRALAFAELRCYEVRLKGPEPTFEPAKLQGWKMTAEEKEGGWEVSCVLMTDPHIESCTRYTILLSGKGEMTIVDRTPVYSRGGYR